MSRPVTQAISDEPLLLRDDADGVATLTLNRPKQYNALSEALLTALQDTLDAIAKDPSVRVLILAGAGKAFCAGHDLKEMRAHPEKAYQQALFQQCSRMMMTITQLPQPVIAKVHGIATAAGCQLVATCDLAIASHEARFATSGVNLGLFCTTPGIAVARNVSRKYAMEMLLTGEFIDADTAARWGLINRAVSADQLDQTVLALARSLAEKSPIALKLGKQAFYRQLEQGLKTAYKEGSEVMACNMMTEDAAEGIDAFIEKRKPTWRGR